MLACTANPFVKGWEATFQWLMQDLLLVNQELGHCLMEPPMASSVGIPSGVHPVAVDTHCTAFIHNLLAIIKDEWDVVVPAVGGFPLLATFFPGEPDFVEVLQHVLVSQISHDFF